MRVRAVDRRRVDGADLARRRVLLQGSEISRRGRHAVRLVRRAADVVGLLDARVDSVTGTASACPWLSSTCELVPFARQLPPAPEPLPPHAAAATSPTIRISTSRRVASIALSPSETPLGDTQELPCRCSSQLQWRRRGTLAFPDNVMVANPPAGTFSQPLLPVAASRALDGKGQQDGSGEFRLRAPKPQ